MKCSFKEELKAIFNINILILELALLKQLPLEFKLHQKEINNYLLVQVEIDSSIIKSALLDKTLKVLQFDILVGTTFPLTPPKVQTLSNVQHTSHLI